ncbi:MAG: SDR family oxidoreductase, partial [Planctomycetes bacterium]|nr:SDR family oxidoreductase [Planctomycetota bacterium]
TEKIRAICRQKNMQILCGRASSRYVYLQILFASEFSFKEAGDLIKKEAEKYFKENIFLFPELMKGGVLWEDEFLAIPFYQAADLDIKSLADDFIKYLDARAESKGFFRRPVKCLVTGGAGFIGSNLVDALIERGDEVIIIDNLSTGKAENINPKAKFHKTDIRDLAAITPLFKDVDYVFHFAAFPRVQPSIEDPATANDINLNGTLNVLIAARDAKIKKVVYSASSSAYGDQTQMPLREDMPAHPLSPYGLQKYAGELYCRLFSDIYGLPTVCLRYFNVYGKRQALEGAYCLVMGIFVNQRLKGEPMTITNDGEQRRDFTSVVDVVQANILAAESDRAGKGEVINIGRGRNFSVNELAALIGGPTKFIGERIEPKETLADNRLARELLGWEPTVELPEWLEGYKKEMGLAN